jgi:hypothetical protein
VEWVQVALCVLTGATLYFLRLYTKETVQLRKATRDQVEVNNQIFRETVELRKAARDQVDATNLVLKETQKQTEQSLMPIVVLTTKPFPDRPPNFVVKNTGNGPALNTRIQPIFHDGLTKSEFRHRSAIGAGEEEPAFLHMDFRPGPLMPGELIVALENADPRRELKTAILYEGVLGHKYRTSYTIKLTAAGKHDLVIQFDGFEKVDHTPA